MHEELLHQIDKKLAVVQSEILYIRKQVEKNTEILDGLKLKVAGASAIIAFLTAIFIEALKTKI